MTSNLIEGCLESSRVPRCDFNLGQGVFTHHEARFWVLDLRRGLPQPRRQGDGRGAAVMRGPRGRGHWPREARGGQRPRGAPWPRRLERERELVLDWEVRGVLARAVGRSARACPGSALTRRRTILKSFNGDFYKADWRENMAKLLKKQRARATQTKEL